MPSPSLVTELTPQRETSGRSRTLGVPPGVRTATSDCADRPPHNARSTPRLLTAAVVLTVELSLWRCAAPAPSSLTTPTHLAPHSWSRQPEKRTRYIDTPVAPRSKKSLHEINAVQKNN